MIEVRLFELQLKGDRLDEINAEAVLNHQAATQARIKVLRHGLHQLSRWLATWLAKPPAAMMAPVRKFTQNKYGEQRECRFNQVNESSNYLYKEKL